MRELSRRLAAISKSDGTQGLEEARRIISTLSTMNMRWNIPGLKKFLIQRQKELFFS